VKLSILRILGPLRKEPGLLGRWGVDDCDSRLPARLNDRQNAFLCNLAAPLQMRLHGMLVPAVDENESDFLGRKGPRHLAVHEVLFPAREARI
jgi:hypothetical protein